MKKLNSILITVLITVMIYSLSSCYNKAEKEARKMGYRSVHEMDSLNRLNQFTDFMDSMHYVNAELFDKYLAIICKRKGHVFEKVDNNFNPYDHNRQPAIYLYLNSRGQVTDKPPSGNKLIETHDSSYIIFQPADIIKYCYRCNQNIVSKPPQKYIKTVWKRKTN